MIGRWIGIIGFALLCAAATAQRDLWRQLPGDDGLIDPTDAAAKIRAAGISVEDAAVGLRDETAATTAVYLVGTGFGGYFADRPSPFQSSVARALNGLATLQAEDGGIGDPKNPRRLYGHAWSLIAMVICRTSDPRSPTPVWKDRIDRGVRFLLEQRGADGIWHLPAQSAEADFVISGLALYALFAAAECGITIDDRTLEPTLRLAEKYVARRPETAATRPATAESGIDGSWRTTTALAVLLRSLWRGHGAEPDDGDGIALDLLEKEPYATKADGDLRNPLGAFWTMLAAQRHGAERMKRISTAMKDWLIKDQRIEAPYAGLRGTRDAFSSFGGVAHSTFLTFLPLEIYYRYPRVLGVVKE